MIITRVGDVIRGNGVHVDAVGAAFSGQGAGKAQNTGLGGHVVNKSLRPLINGVGRNVENASILLFLHVRENRLAAMKKPFQIDGHEPVPFLLRDFVEGL